MTVYLDGCKMTERAALHDHLQQVLALPAHYGRNLDALHDLLCELSGVTITVRNFAAAERSLGGYAGGLRHVLLDAARDNPNLSVEFI